MLRTCLLALILVFTGTTVPALAASEPPEAGRHGFRALVFSKTAGFRHSSIDEGIAALQELAAEHDFEVDATEDASVFTDAGLAAYDVIVFLNTTGDVLDADQQAAMERFIRAGGGFAGIHAAADTEYDWPFYGGLVGAYFESHPEIQTATVKVVDRVHPATAMLPARWVRTDEWYNFQTNPRGDVHVLAVLDETTYSGGTMGHDHPIAWCHGYEGGRAWYTAGGHTEAAYSESLFREHLLHGIEYVAGVVEGGCGATIGANFDKTVLEDEVDDPLDLAVPADGRVLFIEKGGRVRLHDPATGLTTTALSLSVYEGQEDGLLGIALDPCFDTNGWVYLFYSPAGGSPRQHLSRFTMTGGVLDPASEVVLLEVPTQRDECCHSAGSLAFDPDGNLYIATGDDTNPFESDGYAPIDGRTGRAAWDARRTSGNPDDLRGKILRIHPEPDGTYTIPEGNLFPADGTAGRPEVYVMGVRNPFRIAVDPVTGRLYWGDVGPDAGAPSANRGPEGFDEWNRTDTAGNFGWPFCIADNRPYVAYDFATGLSGGAFDCDAPLNDSPHLAAPVTLPPSRPAWIWYPYAPSPEFPAIPNGTGRTALAGPIYEHPGTEAEGALPDYYDGAVFLVEWARSFLLEARLDDDGELLAIQPFLPEITWKRPIAMKQGPDGALYVIEWGTGFGGNNEDAQIVRLAYSGEMRSPVVTLTATPTSGPLPLTVQFSSAGTYDPDTGASLAYAWDFTADGTTDATTPDAAYTYTEAGTFTAILTVTDETGLSGTATVTITAGNTRPEVTIEAPVAGGIFDWGATIPFKAHVTDAEDGATDDGTIDCADVVVQPFIGHDDHSHPLEVLSGCEGSFATEAGHGADGDNLFYLLEVTYTDGGGAGAGALTGSALHRLHPRRLEAEHAPVQVGVQLETTGDVLGGGQNIGYVDHGDYLAFEAVNLAGIGFVTFRVASAGPGGRIEVRADATDGPLLGTAYVDPTGDWQTYTDVTIPVDDPGGTHDLFLVFLRESGDGGLFNLNAITFHGPGVNEPPATPHGLKATYFFREDLSGRTLERTDPQISFNWSTASPMPLFPPDGFSVRWTGEVEAPHGESFVFTTRSRDGVRVWVDGELRIDRWEESTEVVERRSLPVRLEAGQRYPIVVEYFEGTGAAGLQLLWDSPSTPTQTIPERYLYADTTGATGSEPKSALPDKIELETPFPNPFRRHVTVTYRLPTPAEARLELYDLLGRRVAVLSDAPRPAGTHRLVWTPPDLAAGLYLLRLETPDTSLRRTLVHVR